MKPFIEAAQYKRMCIDIFNLIIQEIEDTDDPDRRFPEIGVMYEFYRLLRGEAFSQYHEDMHEFQNDLYKMEHTIRDKMRDTKLKIKNPDRANYFLDIMKKTFTL